MNLPPRRIFRRNGNAVVQRTSQSGGATPPTKVVRQRQGTRDDRGQRVSPPSRKGVQ